MVIIDRCKLRETYIQRLLLLLPTNVMKPNNKMIYGTFSLFAKVNYEQITKRICVLRFSAEFLNWPTDIRLQDYQGNLVEEC